MDTNLKTRQEIIDETRDLVDLANEALYRVHPDIHEVSGRLKKALTAINSHQKLICTSLLQKSIPEGIRLKEGKLCKIIIRPRVVDSIHDFFEDEDCLYLGSPYNGYSLSAYGAEVVKKKNLFLINITPRVTLFEPSFRIMELRFKRRGSRVISKTIQVKVLPSKAAQTFLEYVGVKDVSERNTKIISFRKHPFGLNGILSGILNLGVIRDQKSKAILFAKLSDTEGIAGNEGLFLKLSGQEGQLGPPIVGKEPVMIDLYSSKPHEIVADLTTADDHILATVLLPALPI